MPVTSPMGLVGRVIEVGGRSARVLLLTDSESMVPVRRSTDNVVAFAKKNGFEVKRVIESPVKGAEGNVEFLMQAWYGAL